MKINTGVFAVCNGELAEGRSILGWQINTTPAGEIRMTYHEGGMYRCVEFSKAGMWVETRGTGEPGSEDMEILGQGNLVREGVPFTGDIMISDGDINYRWWVYQHSDQIDVFMRDHNIDELFIVDGPLDQLMFVDRFVDREGYRCITKIYSDEPLERTHPDHGRVDAPLSECSDVSESEHTRVYKPSSNSAWVLVCVNILQGKGGEKDKFTRTLYLQGMGDMHWYANCRDEFYSIDEL